MSVSLAHQNSEDILSDALEFLGGNPVIDDTLIRYGSLALTLAPKTTPQSSMVCIYLRVDLFRKAKCAQYIVQRSLMPDNSRVKKANTLLADHLFSPALFLAERIERGLLDISGKTVIELGAGSALPSLLLGTMLNPPSLVVVTDYPDPGIMGNLISNVQRNAAAVTDGCIVKCSGYDWGTDPAELLGILTSISAPDKGYDVMILSDLLHFSDSHDALLSSITMLLGKTKEARVYVGAGSYTHAHICDSFLQKGKAIGLHLEEIIDTEEWLGKLLVSDLDHEALSLRKSNCRYWIGHWSLLSD